MTGPLQGITVLDLSWYLAGPYCTQILADLGAEVIKIEPPAGDHARHIPPYLAHGESAYFMSVNRGKKSVVLDLKQPAGRQALLDLAARADVLVEAFRPSVPARLGIDYAAVAAVNPHIIYCSLTGFGQTGPYRERPAYDMIVQAIAGGMSLTGEPGGKAVRAGIPIGDLAAGLFAAIAILAALHGRSNTGQGEYIDISMLDCQVSMLVYLGVNYLLTGEVAGPQGRGHIAIPTYRSFEAADRRDVLVAANTERMWRSLCAVLGLDELAEDPRFATNADRLANQDALIPLLESRFRTRPSDEWLTLLEQAGIPAAPINTVDRALNDPHIQERGMVITLDHPVEGSIRLLGNPIKLAGYADHSVIPPPALGQDTIPILRDRLGYDHERVQAASNVPVGTTNG